MQHHGLRVGTHQKVNDIFSWDLYLSVAQWGTRLKECRAEDILLFFTEFERGLGIVLDTGPKVIGFIIQRENVSCGVFMVPNDRVVG